MREKLLMIKCVVCHGFKAIPGKSSGPYPGSPATLPCKRCDSIGEIPLETLTEEERNPKPKQFFERTDNP